MRSNKKKKPHVFIAETHDCIDCLSYLGIRPLKLIANSLYPQESEWKDMRWTFKSSGTIVQDKKVIVNPKDTFQLSIANEFSKQDFHVHNSTLEIYISDSRMELVTEDEGKHICNKGIVIVPPEVPHRITLSGMTYVIQVMQKNLPINSDKEILRGHAPKQVRIK